MVKGLILSSLIRGAGSCCGRPRNSHNRKGEDMSRPLFFGALLGGLVVYAVMAPDRSRSALGQVAAALDKPAQNLVKTVCECIKGKADDPTAPEPSSEQNKKGTQADDGHSA